jgi:pantoate kinase
MNEEEPARAFVPGHVTGFFSAHSHDDPERAGSRGAGVTLTDGVTVEVSPAETTAVNLDGRQISVEAVAGVLDALGVSARVEAETPLPLGSGFGVSGALALGTALAANYRFDCGRSENELITIAHVAEVRAGSGLGDVVAQARGGVPIRLEPGAPEHNHLDGIPAGGVVEYLTLGELSTAEVISGDTDRLSNAGEAALTELRRDPTLETFVWASRQFAREADLLTPAVEEIIEDVRATGGAAAMAMLGETVFAPDTGLSDAGYEATACRIHPAGATLRDG